MHIGTSNDVRCPGKGGVRLIKQELLVIYSNVNLDLEKLSVVGRCPLNPGVRYDRFYCTVNQS